MNSGSYACIENCSTVTAFDTTVTLRMFPHPGIMGTANGQPACDEVAFVLQVQEIGLPPAFSFSIGTNPPVNNVRSSFLSGKYMRTWVTIDSDGFVHQFWRFLVSGDAVWQSGARPCPIPPCIPTYPSMSMHGHIDIECTEFNPHLGEYGWSFNTQLTHYAGCLSHINIPQNTRNLPPSSLRHDDTSYHFVAPGGFNWLANPPAAASLNTASNLDALRSTVSHVNTPIGQPSLQVCQSEAALRTWGQPVSVTCACGQPGNFYYNQNWPGGPNQNAALCPMSFEKEWSSLVLVPEIPTGFVQQYLGEYPPAGVPYVMRGIKIFAVLGTVSYDDFCDLRLDSEKETTHVVFGSNHIYDPRRQNEPILFASFTTFGPTTDMLLDFGNNVLANDSLLAGAPGWTNILWMISR